MPKSEQPEFNVGAQAVLEALQVVVVQEEGCVVVDGGYHYYELSHWELGYSKDDLLCLYLVHPPVVMTTHPQEDDDEERAKHPVIDKAFALEDDDAFITRMQESSRRTMQQLLPWLFFNGPLVL
jgi:hypothetical protein